MGCGMGGCYSCVIPVKDAGGGQHYVRSCIGGPVFKGADWCGIEPATMDLSVQIGSLRLANPLMAASGCFGYGVEYADAVDLASIGAVVSKGLFIKER